MGKYIEGPTYGKVEMLKQNGAKICGIDEAKQIVAQGEDATLAVIVVVENGFFEAAGWAYDEGELKAFTSESDNRPRTILKMDRELVVRLTTKVN